MPISWRSLAVRGVVAAAAVAVTLGALELGLRLMPPTPDGLNRTRSAQEWMRRHWGTRNRQGFRDADHTGAQLAAARRLYVVGDSFAAGHGIARRSDRFSDLLGERLGPPWLVLNMARGGWNTPEEIAALEEAAYPPHAVLLSYFVNDIEAAARRHGVHFDLALDPPAWLAPVVAHSYLGDFVYWRLVRIRQTEADYFAYLRGCFADPAIWNAHTGELRAVADLARGHEAPLVVVIFPDLRHADQWREITARVAELFRSLGASVVDLADHLAGRDPAALMVNSVDPHPNEALHREVAALVSAKLAMPPARR